MKRFLIFVSLLFALAAPAGAQTVLTGTTCPGSGCDTTRISGAGVSFQITGTFSGTLTFTQSNSGIEGDFVSLTVYANGSTTGVTSTTTTGLYTGSTTARYVRVAFTSHSSGTATVYQVTTQARAQNPNTVTGSGAFSDTVTITKDNVAQSTTVVGELLQNTTASTALATRQFAPGFKMCGSAWKSDATAASQTNCWTVQTKPQTGASVTTDFFTLSSSINGGASTEVFSLTSGGNFNVTGGGIYGASSSVGFSGRTTFQAPSDGTFQLSVNAGNDFGRLMLGGTTSSFPAIKRSGATVHFRTADDGAFADTRAALVNSNSQQMTATAAAGVVTDQNGMVGETTTKMTITGASAFVCNATTCDITVATTQARTWIRNVTMRLVTTFACTATCDTAQLTAQLGVSAGGTELLASADVHTGTTTFGDSADSELGTLMVRAAAIQGGTYRANSTAINLRLTSGSGVIGNGTVSNLSQGSIILYITTLVLP